MAIRITGNIGGELTLVDWQISWHTAIIKSANIALYNIVSTCGWSFAYSLCVGYCVYNLVSLPQVAIRTIECVESVGRIAFFLC